jgi:hypothetical protein
VGRSNVQNNLVKCFPQKTLNSMSVKENRIWTEGNGVDLLRNQVVPEDTCVLELTRRRLLWWLVRLGWSNQSWDTCCNKSPATKHRLLSLLWIETSTSHFAPYPTRMLKWQALLQHVTLIKNRRTKSHNGSYTSRIREGSKYNLLSWKSLFIAWSPGIRTVMKNENTAKHYGGKHRIHLQII